MENTNNNNKCNYNNKHSIGNASTRQHLTSAAGVSSAALNGPGHAELTAHLTRPDHTIMLIMMYETQHVQYKYQEHISPQPQARPERI